MPWRRRPPLLPQVRGPSPQQLRPPRQLPQRRQQQSRRRSRRGRPRRSPLSSYLRPHRLSSPSPRRPRQFLSPRRQPSRGRQPPWQQHRRSPLHPRLRGRRPRRQASRQALSAASSAVSSARSRWHSSSGRSGSGSWDGVTVAISPSREQQCFSLLSILRRLSRDGHRPLNARKREASARLRPRVVLLLAERRHRLHYLLFLSF